MFIYVFMFMIRRVENQKAVASDTKISLALILISEE